MKKTDDLKQINEKLDAISRDLNNPITKVTKIGGWTDLLCTQLKA